MGMKFFFFFLMVVCINGIGQGAFDTICDPSLIKKDTIIKIFIKGIGNVYEAEAKFFQKDFELTSTDSSIVIVSFRLLVDSKDLMMNRANKGKKVEPDLIENGVDKGKDYSLKYLSAVLILPSIR